MSLDEVVVLSRAFHSILSSDLPRAREWYILLFGYEATFDSDWFVHLQHPRNGQLEIGVIAIDHEIVTEAMRKNPVGGVLNFVVDDVDALHHQAVKLGVPVVAEPANLFYGQRRMLIADPDGQLIDVSSECPPDPKWLATLT